MPIQSDAQMEAIVCVPARNEANRIGCLLRSLAAQTVASARHPLKVVVICNNSVDGTADIVRDFAGEPRLIIRLFAVTLPSETAHAGTARRMAMNAGADWIDAYGIDDGVLISTDADAIAPKGWVAANIDALAHADLVGGRLVLAGEGDIPSSLTNLHERIERYWAAVRALEDLIDPPEHDPAPRHGDHTGASLALRATLYRSVGGIPPIPSGEDNALVGAVVRHGGRVRHCPNVWIEVSAREAGRATGGMAAEMVRRRKALDETAPYLLPRAAFWREQFQRRATWRGEWPLQGGGQPNAIAYVAYREDAAACAPAPQVPVDEAIDELEVMATLASMR